MSNRPVLIVGVDGGAGARHALGVAAELAGATGAALVAVHVAQVPAAVHMASGSAAAALVSAIDLAADHAHFDCELILAGRDVPWTFEARHGDTVTELLRAAEDHEACYTIVGRRRRVVVTRMLTRSVTEGDVPSTTDTITVADAAGNFMVASRADINGRIVDLLADGALVPMLTVDGDVTEEHLTAAREAAEKLLSNPVIEDVVSVRALQDADRETVQDLGR